VDKTADSSSPNTTTTSLEGPPKLSLATELAAEKSHRKPADQPENIRTSTIRVDAFLGEWLSPDYFDHITPPPSSRMMVAGAKADLHRAEDYSNLVPARDTASAAPRGFPGGWGSPIVLPTVVGAERNLSDLSSLAQSLPEHKRAGSLGGVAGHGSSHRGRSPNKAGVQKPGEHGTYQPPVPTYAISSSNPIPSGYVAHARDACVEVDYQWDSMREPPGCGNGGEYGEEWSSMHMRFRKGFQQLSTWYEDNDNPDKLMYNAAANADAENGHDDDTDLVLILVSHGAGCNALIGALTNQPVLIDVGMASLTMAVRKPAPVDTPNTTPGVTPRPRSPVNSTDISVSDQYDVKLIANTEHLRPSTANTPSSSRRPSAAGLPAFRERFGSNAASMDGVSLSKAARSATTSGSLGSMRRTASIATSGPRKYMQSSVGLWSAPVGPEEVLEEAEEEEMILKVEDARIVSANLRGEQEVVAADNAKGKGEDVVAPPGLWGAPRPPGDAEKMREFGTKRRWTVTDRG
jgi:hypothetical protein